MQLFFIFFFEPILRRLAGIHWLTNQTSFAGARTKHWLTKQQSRAAGTARTLSSTNNHSNQMSYHHFVNENP